MPPPRPILAYQPDIIQEQQLRTTIESWGESFQLRCWSDENEFGSEVIPFLPRAVLIVLADHDRLHAWLSDFEPVCPVFCNKSSPLRMGGWPVIESLDRPLEPHPALEKMRNCLIGLAIGDSLGEMLSHSAAAAPSRLRQPGFPEHRLYHTDDTEMALSIYSVLRSHGFVHQDALASRFARRFQLDPDRGYGKMTRIQLNHLVRGGDWREGSRTAFGGQGSAGNGSAMRVAPLGAFFAHDLDKCAQQARASSEITHSHPEAMVGATAVAVAAALACQTNRIEISEVLKHLPQSQLRSRLEMAKTLVGSHFEAAKVLGCGALVTAADTVPYCIWLASNHTDFIEAIGQAIEVDGDCDTCAAITGALVALTHPETIPTPWIKKLDPCLRL